MPTHQSQVFWLRVITDWWYSINFGEQNVTFVMFDNDIETFDGYSQVEFLWDFFVKKKRWEKQKHKFSRERHQINISMVQMYKIWCICLTSISARRQCVIHMEISPSIDACLHMLVFPFKHHQQNAITDIVVNTR